MNSLRLRRKRIAFWHKDPNCFWCGEKTLLLETTGSRLCKRDFDNPKRATIDHLVSRGQTLRDTNAGHSGKKKSYNYGHLVLACNKCNAERGVKQSKLNNMRLKILSRGTKPTFCIL